MTKFGTFATLFLLANVSACTTIPEPSDGFSARHPDMGVAKGMRGKRLASAPPSPPIEEGSKLFLEPVAFTADARVTTGLSESQRGLVLNAVARNLCGDLSRHFEIVNSSQADGAFRLRTFVTQLTQTNQISAGIGAITSRLAPVGVRPPLGLGALTVEFELIRPDGTDATSMVWSQKADGLSADASISKIGDAYALANSAASDFATLVRPRSGSTRIAQTLRDQIGQKSDAACAVYGDGPNFAAGFFPIPPEMSDKGPKP